MIRFSYPSLAPLALALLVALAASTGCGDDTPPADSGTADSGDAGAIDSSTPDTGTPDDSGMANDSTTPMDSGMGEDSGMATDSSVTDGSTDAGLPDSGRPVGATCTANAQCESNVCIAGACRAVSCTDGVLNGEETDVDCGGTMCMTCPNGGVCLVPGDCVSNLCTDGTCDTPGCADGVINQDETDVDCGGAICTDRCTVGEMCTAGTDCDTASCMSGTCRAPSCTDGVRNGSETDIDCGGPAAAGCPRCADFKVCLAPSDCADGNCISGYCGTNPCIPFASDTFGYTGCSYTPTTLPCPDIRTTGTASGLDDDAFVAVPIGFSFDFYGMAHTMVTVEANGALNFDALRLFSGNSCLPATGAFSSTRFIATLWDDLDPSEAGSEVYYQTIGTAPNRQFVVQWDTARFGAGSDRAVVTVVLAEGSSDIDVCYLDTDFSNPTYDDGVSATSAVQGSATNYMEFSCNMPNLTDGLLVRYLHP